MKAAPRVHLALVGKPRLPTVQGQLSPELWQRTHVLGRLDDLPGFLVLCDALFCPKQRGSGFTHCTAMALGVPTVIEFEPLGDVTANVGRDFTFEGQDAVREALFRVVDDASFRQNLIERGQAIMQKRKEASESCIQRLFEFFPLAEARFLARTKSRSVSSRPPGPSRTKSKRSHRKKKARAASRR